MVSTTISANWPKGARRVAEYFEDLVEQNAPHYPDFVIDLLRTAEVFASSGKALPLASESQALLGEPETGLGDWFYGFNCLFGWECRTKTGRRRMLRLVRALLAEVDEEVGHG